MLAAESVDEPAAAYVPQDSLFAAGDTVASVLNAALGPLHLDLFMNLSRQVERVYSAIKAPIEYISQNQPEHGDRQ